MKIAFLTPEFPHERIGHSGGIGTSIKHLAIELERLGHDVSLLIYGQKEDAFFEENGLQFYLVKNVKFKGLSWWLTRKKIQKLINKLHKSKKIDIIEAPDWTGITSYINVNCPIVIRENGSDTYFCHLDNRPVKAINRFHEKKALQSADGIIAVSTYTGALTNKLFGLKTSFTVVPNAVNMLDFIKSNRSSIDNSPPVILYFGTLIRKKGLLELPLIFNLVHDQCPEAVLVLVGKDSHDIKTKSSSTWKLMQPLFNESAYSNVNYLGAVDYSQMREKVETATVCVFPTFAEALPVSWLEAMALERPVVASNVGWATDIIDDGINGFLVHPTKHEDYSKRILEVINDKDKQHEFGRAAKQKIESYFSAPVVAEKSFVFYKKHLK